MRAGIHTFPAPDALGMVWGTEYVYIHFADPAARTAGCAFIMIDMQSVARHFIKQCVKCTQWAEPFTEWPVEKHRKYNYPQQNTAFPGEQPAEARPDRFIRNRQRDSAFQNPGRTDVFTEKWVPHPHFIYNRNRQHQNENDQNDVL